MKKRIAVSIIWALFLVGMVQARPTDLPFFPGSMEQLKDQARLSRVPYMVYFYVLECEPCRKMQKETFNHEPLIRNVEQNYLAYRVDGLDFLAGIDIAKEYGVRSYPTTIVFGPDGDIRNRMEGFVSGATLNKTLIESIKPGDRNLTNRVTTAQPLPETGSTTARLSPPTNEVGQPPQNAGLPGWAIARNSGNSTLYASPLTEAQEKGISQPQTSPPVTNDKRGFVSEYLQERSDQFESNQPYGSWSGNNTNPYSDSWRSSGSERGSAYPNEIYTGNDRGSDGLGTSAYVEDRNPGYVNPFAPNSPQRNRGQNEDGSFLDPVRVANANQGGLPDYVWDGDKWVARNTLPADAQLYLGADGQWHVSKGTSEDGANMRFGPETTGEEAVIETIPAVPGFSDEAPKKLKQETYGLLVGEYDNISGVKKGLDTFKENNPGIPVWVFAERQGTSTVYKLAMGTYSSPDAATTDAMARGADWNEIRVVQLKEVE